jgi:hypothetical protein
MRTRSELPLTIFINRLFVVLSGLVHVTLPGSSYDAWIMEGVNPVLVAADLTGSGHTTEYPSNKETVALQLPFLDGKAPEHEVLHRGACTAMKQVQDNCDDHVTAGSNSEL